MTVKAKEPKVGDIVMSDMSAVPPPSEPSREELLEALAAAIEAVPPKTRMYKLPELIRGLLK